MSNTKDQKTAAPANTQIPSGTIKEGACLVHPVYGIGTVERLDMSEADGKRSETAEIYFSRDMLKIRMNLSISHNMVRPPIKKEEIEGVIAYLREYESDIPVKSPDRYNINLRKTKSTDIRMLAQVIKDLTNLSKHKKLTPKEQSMLKGAKRSLAAEFAFSSGTDAEEAGDLVERTCRNL